MSRVINKGVVMNVCLAFLFGMLAIGSAILGVWGACIALNSVAANISLGAAGLVFVCCGALCRAFWGMK